MSLLVRFVLCTLGIFLFGTAATNAASSNDILAEIDGESITAEQVEKAIGAPLAKLQEQLYNLKREKLEAMIADRLLAKEAARRGISVSALLDKEVTAKVGLVTEEEVDTFYKANKSRIQGDEATVRQQIRSYLQNQKLGTKREEFLRSLKDKATVKVHLQPPPVLRVDVNISGAPFKGGAKAPVTIVKFEDYQCPFCKQVQGTFTQLLSKYGNKVKLVHRDFPIDSLHPQARRAAEGARCANEQGKFWTLHDKLYAADLKSEPNQLSNLAKEAGLDVSAFDRCLSSEKYKAAVQKDVEEGQQLGVTGTPAFFINGRPLSGAQSFDSFVRIIDDELARAK